MSTGDIVGCVIVALIIYIMFGGLAWSIMDYNNFEDDAAILCAVVWPATALVWACIGFVLAVLYIPKALFRCSVRLAKSAAKGNHRSKRVTREVK